jgi:hypothetical protein
MEVTLPVPMLNPSRKIPGRNMAKNFKNLLRMVVSTDEFSLALFLQGLVVMLSPNRYKLIIIH